MGLFGFGKKKKTEEEIVAEGRDYYLNGDNRHAYLALHGLAHKGENAEACYYYGLVRLEGFTRPNIPPNQEEGMKYIRKAASLGHAEASAMLGQPAAHTPKPAAAPKPVPEPKPAPAPKPVPEPKPAPAPKPVPGPKPSPLPAPRADVENRKAAEAMHKQQEEERERMFLTGNAAFQAEDYTKAFYWFEKAAELGDATSQCNCGLMCDEGIGTAVDKGKALMWLEKAAKQGMESAYYPCAEAHFYNNPSLNYLQEALKWYRKACDVEDETEILDAMAKVQKIEGIISAIQQVQSGTSKTDRKISNIMSLPDHEADELIESIDNLSKNQQIAVAHFQSVMMFAKLEEFKDEENRRLIAKAAGTIRDVMMDIMTEVMMNDMMSDGN